MGLDSDQANVLANRGYARMKLEDYAGAINDLSEALRYVPTLWPAFFIAHTR